MTTTTNRLRTDGRLGRATVFGLLAFAAVLCAAPEARAQWTAPDTQGNINTTNTGNVGIGTTTPKALLELHVSTGDVVNRLSNAGGIGGALDLRYRYESSAHRMGLSDGLGNWMFYTQFAPSNVNSFGYFPGKVGIGTESPGYPLTVRANTNVAPLNLIGGTGSMEIWKDSNPLPSKAVAFGAAVPGNAAGDDIHLSTYNGAAWSSRVTVANSSGNVGIGTTTPSALLSLRVNTGDVVSRFSNAGGSAGELDLRYKYESSKHRMGLSDANGQWMFYTQFAPSNSDSVGFFPGKVGIGTAAPAAALHVAGDIRVAGVVSAQPGISLGEAGADKSLIATTGRVKVRVDATRSPIRVGDLLVTGDTPGVAMRSQPLDLGGVPIHRPGTLIGKALESLEKGTGEILVLLSLQ